MPRYFFHTENSTLVIDRDGTEYPSLQEAKDEAITLAGEILKDKDGEFWNSGYWRMHVTDETDRILFVLRLGAEFPKIPLKLPRDEITSDSRASAQTPDIGVAKVF